MRLSMLAAFVLVFEIAGAHAETVPLGLTPITFTDTSGELRDQKATHDHRLAEFIGRLKLELQKSAQFELADVPCTDNQCRPADTLAKARDEGKRYVLFCALQKTSSLVLWARVDVVEASTEKVVVTRLITFRGDTDEAWSRTARFIGRAINDGFAK